jgi:hypothetical protein
MIVAAVLVVLWLNVAATVRLWRSAAYSHDQKLYQLAMVWVLPIIGALFVVMVIWSDKSDTGALFYDEQSHRVFPYILLSFLLLDFSNNSGRSNEICSSGNLDDLEN